MLRKGNGMLPQEPVPCVLIPFPSDLLPLRHKGPAGVLWDSGGGSLISGAIGNLAKVGPQKWLFPLCRQPLRGEKKEPFLCPASAFLHSAHGQRLTVPLLERLPRARDWAVQAASGG